MIGSQSSLLQPFLDHWPKQMGRESLADMLIEMTKFNDLTLFQILIKFRCALCREQYIGVVSLLPVHHLYSGKSLSSQPLTQFSSLGEIPHLMFYFISNFEG